MYYNINFFLSKTILSAVLYWYIVLLQYLYADIWKRIRKWLKLFEGARSRKVEILHVKAHSGINGNERADSLAGQGAKLRFKLMDSQGWFQFAVKRYWSNRRSE